MLSLQVVQKNGPDGISLQIPGPQNWEVIRYFVSKSRQPRQGNGSRGEQRAHRKCRLIPVTQLVPSELGLEAE